MPKAGSGFMRAAGNAAKAIFGRGGGRNWVLYNVSEGVEAVQALYGRTYRNGDVTFEYDSRGRLQNIGGKNFNRFAEGAETIAHKLAQDVRIIDREMERQYSEMSRWARSITASAQERKEFDRTYEGDKNFSGTGRSRGDASEIARQMAKEGLLSHEIAGLGNNVDIMNGINKAMNAVKSMIMKSVPANMTDQYEADIMEGITSRYEGVVKGANRRRRR